MRSSQRWSRNVDAAIWLAAGLLVGVVWWHLWQRFKNRRGK
jgi:hypothetical protein